MSPRKRDARKRGWPTNLYERNGYFSWRNPIDGTEHGLGRDKRIAFVQAIEANVHVAGLTGKARLIDRLTGAADRSWGAWLDEYEKALKQKELAENTRRSYASLHRLARQLFDLTIPIERITTKDVADALIKVAGEGKRRQAQALRSRLKEIFRAAHARGWVKENPVEVTDMVNVKVKRARLPWDVFIQLYRATEISWLKNAMALAITTAQRREDIAVATFRDVHDDAWWCVQKKTGNRVCLPLGLRLDVFGMSLGEVVKQCRATGVISKHLVHQVRPRGNSPVGQQIWKDTLSRTFSDELDKLSVKIRPFDWQGYDPPTFHEIRSLAERLYSEQGNVKTQDLLGHKDPRTTALYHDSRGTEWVRVIVGSGSK